MSEEIIDSIIEKMLQPRRHFATYTTNQFVDLRPHRDALKRLLRDVYEAHEYALDDWNTRNSPDRPDKALRKNIDKDQEQPYDYGADAGSGLTDEDWREHFDRHYKRPEGNPGRFRDDSGLGKPPLTGVLHIVNEWWRGTLDRRFHPDFSALESLEEWDDKHLPKLNPAARFFYLVAQDVDPLYTIERCRLTADEKYKKLRR